MPPLGLVVIIWVFGFETRPALAFVDWHGFSPSGMSYYPGGPRLQLPTDLYGSYGIRSTQYSRFQPHREGRGRVSVAAYFVAW